MINEPERRNIQGPDQPAKPDTGLILLTSTSRDITQDDVSEQHFIFQPDPWVGLHRIQKWLQDRELAQVLVLDPNVDAEVCAQVREFASRVWVPVLGVSMHRGNISQDLSNVVALAQEVVCCGQPRPVTLSGGHESTLGSGMVLSLGFVDGVIQGFGEFP